MVTNAFEGKTVTAHMVEPSEEQEGKEHVSNRKLSMQNPPPPPPSVEIVWLRFLLETLEKSEREFGKECAKQQWNLIAELALKNI